MLALPTILATSVYVYSPMQYFTFHTNLALASKYDSNIIFLHQWEKMESKYYCFKQRLHDYGYMIHEPQSDHMNPCIICTFLTQIFRLVTMFACRPLDRLISSIFSYTATGQNSHVDLV